MDIKLIKRLESESSRIRMEQDTLLSHPLDITDPKKFEQQMRSIRILSVKQHSIRSRIYRQRYERKDMIGIEPASYSPIIKRS